MRLFLPALRHALRCAARALVGLAGAAQAQPAPDTLVAVRACGYLVCGVSINAVGFALPDTRGEFRGLDVDACRAVAAAVLGDAAKVRFVPTTSQVCFPALQSGEVDMLARNTTWTLGREAQRVVSTRRRAAAGRRFASPPREQDDIP